MAPCLAADSSRDLLLTIRNKAAPLDHRVRQLISRLGLCLRGCRAGAHYHRRLLVACSVTSSTSRTAIAGEIPTISGHRFVNNDQLIQQHRADCVSVCNVQSDSAQLSSVFVEHFERPTEFSLTEYPTLSCQVERESTIQPIVCPPFSSFRQEVTHTGLQSTEAQVTDRRTRQCKRTQRRQRSALINCISVTHTGSQRLSVCIRKDALSLIVLNAHSIVKRNVFHMLTAEVLSMQPNLICICETWFKDKHSEKLFTIDGYTCHRRDRKGKAAGGVCMYIRNELRCRQLLVRKQCDNVICLRCYG